MFAGAMSNAAPASANPVASAFSGVKANEIKLAAGLRPNLKAAFVSIRVRKSLNGACRSANNGRSWLSNG